ncbi:glycosyltransferase family 9 protein, partial [bacterium]
YTKQLCMSKQDHIIKKYYTILDFFGCEIEEIDFHPRIVKKNYPYEYTILRNIPIGKKIVGIDLGNRHCESTIPFEILIPIINYLKNHSVKVVLFAKHEDAIADLLEKTDNYPVFLQGRFASLRDAMIHLDLFIGSDNNGLLHLAAALDIPSIGMYGPMLSETTAPISKDLYIFEKELGCRPCKDEKKCHKKLKCFHDISNRKVIERIKKVLKIHNYAYECVKNE